MKKNYEEYNIHLYPQDVNDHHRNYWEREVLSSPLHQNLQNFSRQVSYLSAFHTNGKMSTAVVCEHLNRLWQSLESSNN